MLIQTYSDRLVFLCNEHLVDLHHMITHAEHLLLPYVIICNKSTNACVNVHVQSKWHTMFFPLQYPRYKAMEWLTIFLWKLLFSTCWRREYRMYYSLWLMLDEFEPTCSYMWVSTTIPWMHDFSPLYLIPPLILWSFLTTEGLYDYSDWLLFN